MNPSNPLTISETNELIKSIITENLNEKIYIKGEMFNIKNSYGNMYFSLRDEKTVISAILWKNNNKYENGETVIVSGKIVVYPKYGSYQINVNSIERDGIGDIHNKYNKIKQKMESEGLFDKKREFPKNINKICILTSLEGAALQDILYVLKNNNYIGEIYLKNCFVQGSNAPTSIKEGIEYFNKINEQYNLNFDILIIARGGGAMEDLIGYSSEEVCRAIYNSNIFTISAVGHEVDNMISDYVADFRAPTPSIAGETIVKFQKQSYSYVYELQNITNQFKNNIMNDLTNLSNKLQYFKNIHKCHNPANLLETEIKQIQSIQAEIKHKITNDFIYKQNYINNLISKNKLYDTQSILMNGYVLMTDEYGNIINSAKDYNNKQKNKEKIKITFYDGNVII
ncbi:exodeoxyribonuclease VII large subunit [Bodo saltans virus]|uniref:Exodeoxyribonuclease VII large subunit n=1 Tax=Bodo saltans virus TaxID=2024608 RepID=A0A2H4UVM9_9VIRU|nr:exodeoxyribonuclease VII large subunit [Bodo saltans virus]ATZ80885.1 exodeoxyribonuclease VII large subunit [Bodo saltans virus]